MTHEYPYNPTFDSVSISRVTGLAHFGFTRRQREFLVTVMVHSGCFLERQYCAFTGTARGQNSREFVARLGGPLAYDERLAERIRRVLGHRPDVTERKCLRIAFLRDGRMCHGIVGQSALVLRSTHWGTATYSGHHGAVLLAQLCLVFFEDVYPVQVV